jgi:hypothetical protein
MYVAYESDQAKKMGWKNPPIGVFSETWIVLCKSRTGNRFTDGHARIGASF